jgi:hypothetical protein
MVHECNAPYGGYVMKSKSKCMLWYALLLSCGAIEVQDRSDSTQYLKMGDQSLWCTTWFVSIT